MNGNEHKAFDHSTGGKLIAGIDIGGTKIAIGLVDDRGCVRARAQMPTCAEAGYRNALDGMVRRLREVSQSAKLEISGIGIGSTGPVYPFTGEIGEVNFFPHWKGENPVKDLGNIFQVKVALENDGDAAALGEFGWGAGRNKRRLMYVTIGTGIGAGFIIDGQLYRGADYSHPEIGHHLVDPSGPKCACGFRGCWESVAAGPAMSSWLEEVAPSDYQWRGTELTAKRICELATQGDEFARRAVEREGHYLGLGLANLITMFVPDCIVLGGSLMNSADLFLPQIRNKIQDCCRMVPFEQTELALASLGQDSNLIGAARVWYHRFAQGRNQGAC